LPPFEPGHPKVGGRSAGTPNKGTALVKEFFEGVLEKAFADPSFAPRLVQAIVTLELDPKIFLRILEYVGGRPDQGHKHGVDGTVLELFEAIAGKRSEGDAS
jgi:hypothetical protein